MAVATARSIIERAVVDRTFPAAAVEAGSSTGSLWRDAFGSLTFEGSAARTTIDTSFDLASLTKPLATTVVMDLIRRGRIRLDDRLETFFKEWRGVDRSAVTVRDLLEHASGLSARLVDNPPSTRREFEHDICTMPLEYRPRTQSIYSDLDFILLGFLIEDRGGASLAAQFRQIWASIQETVRPDADLADALTFVLSSDARRSVAPTWPLENDPRRGRVLVGEVHDDYAAALGGVAGHSGLFGTVQAVGTFARVVLSAARGDGFTPPPLTKEAVALFTARSSVPRSSRALGWDTMLPTSSCGTRMSAAAFGHVGFTGTSLWIDPVRDRYFVLLTNRACGGGSLDQMRDLRRAFHDALGDF